MRQVIHDKFSKELYKRCLENERESERVKEMCVYMENSSVRRSYIFVVVVPTFSQEKMSFRYSCFI